MNREELGRKLHEEGHEELFSSGLTFVSQYVQEHDMNHVLWEGGKAGHREMFLTVRLSACDQEERKLVDELIARFIKRGQQNSK